MKLQKLDYVTFLRRVGEVAEGTVYQVLPDGGFVGWTDYSRGQLVEVPAAAVETARVLVRDGKRFTGAR